MGARRLLRIGAFLLFGLFAAGPAWAYIDWAGAGWYVEGTALGFATELISGPYADQNACNAAKPADNNEVGYSCQYEGTDPHYDAQPPAVR